MIIDKQCIYIVLVCLLLWYCYSDSIEFFGSPPTDPLLRILQRDIRILIETFGQSSSKYAHPEKIAFLKRLNLQEGKQSYTINKKNVFICLKDRNGRYYSRNMLVYVICHEFAHILCEEVGHTEEFMNIFEDILYTAESIGLYDPYEGLDDDYCGHI